MKFARFEVDRAPGPDTVTMKARLRGAEGFAKPVELLVLSASAPREALDRFLQGGARLAELADGNLLQVLEVGYEDGRAFLATEASAGVTLAKLLEQSRARGLDALPLSLAFGIGGDLAKALAHAHAHTDVENRPDPVTHGALRSEAVTVGEDGAVKLGGFVPWRSAPSPGDDVEKLVDLVGQWVTDPDKKLLRESASGVTSAAQLRKSWAAFTASHFPHAAPDARRAWLAFARGEVSRGALEGKLGQPKERASIPPWAFVVAAGAVVLLGAALLWPSDPVPQPVIAPAPAKKQPKPPPERFHAEVHVKGAEHHLELPASLPALASKEALWFGESPAPVGDAPQLFVRGESAAEVRFSTVPLGFTRLSSATKLTVFSWVPFEARFRSPGMRSLRLFATLPWVPLVEEWMEVSTPGAHLRLPPHKQLSLSLRDGPAGAVVLVAASYGLTPLELSDPKDSKTRWPYQPTRLVLTAERSSATVDDAQELAFVTPGNDADVVVSVDEGPGTPFDQQWPEWRVDPSFRPAIMHSSDINGNLRDLKVTPLSVAVTGHVPGLENRTAFSMLSQCFGHDARGGVVEAPNKCFHHCVNAFPDAYECWHQLALLHVPGAAEKFAATAKDQTGHPYLQHVDAAPAR